jgi:hypothetical protein
MPNYAIMIACLLNWRNKMDAKAVITSQYLATPEMMRQAEAGIETG